MARLFAGRLEAAGDDERGMLELGRLYAVEALEGRPVALPPAVTRVD